MSAGKKVRIPDYSGLPWSQRAVVRRHFDNRLEAPQLRANAAGHRLRCLK
jgi:hypothetical protein